MDCYTKYYDSMSHKKVFCNSPAETFCHIIYNHDVLPSLDVLADWMNPPLHRWLFDVTLTYHSTDVKIVHGIVARVVRSFHQG